MKKKKSQHKKRKRMDFLAYLARIAAPDLAAGREGSKAEAGKGSPKGSFECSRRLTTLVIEALGGGC